MASSLMPLSPFRIILSHWWNGLGGFTIWNASYCRFATMEKLAIYVVALSDREWHYSSTTKELGHVQHPSLPRLRLGNFTQNSSVPPGDGLPVISWGDAEGLCSEVQSTERAALYDRVFSSRRHARIPRGALADCGLVVGWYSAPRHAGRAAPVASSRAPLCFHDLPLIAADTMSFMFVLLACYCL
jgi:hypothetical protein